MAYGDRADVADLRTLLRAPVVQKDPELYLKAVRKVIGSMTLGVDVSSIFTEMIKAGDTTRVVQKKLVYLYLSNYGSAQPELALLTLNTLRKDLDSHNAMIRGLALRTLSYLRSTDVVNYLPEALQRGLTDNSSYVRKSAVMGVVKLFYADPNTIDEMNFVDVLYQMLRDCDAQVVSNCIAALSEILANEGGMVMNRKIAHYLLNRLDDFSEWGQHQIMELLILYHITSEEELFDVLNILDVKLKSSNAGVVLAVTRLFLHFTSHMPHLQDDICERVRDPMLTFSCIDYIEIAFVFLAHVKILLTKFPQMWRRSYKSFYLRETDPLFVKLKKIEVLNSICMFESVPHITSELSVYSTDSNSLVSRAAIRALGSIAQRIPSKANECVDQLLPHLGSHANHTKSETLVVITSILRKFDTMLEYLLPKLPHYSGLTESSGKAALIWILGEYGEHLPNTPYVLEKAAEGVAEESSPEVKLQLLTAVMKMFFKRPPECQETLGRLLDHAINEEENMDVRDRGLLYYRLLKKDLKMAKKIVCGMPKLVELPLTSTVGAHLFPEFNTLAILLEKPSNQFIEQRCPYIATGEGTSSGAEAWFESVAGSVYTATMDSSLTLNPQATISPGDFEQKWRDLNVMKEMHVHVEKVLPHEQFIKRLSSHHILNMAASPPHQKLVKYFFYSQEVIVHGCGQVIDNMIWETPHPSFASMSSQNYLLLEVDIAEDNNMLSCLIKSESPQQSAWLSHKFLKALNLSMDSSPLLTCKACSDIPTGMLNASGTFYHNQLYVSGETSFNKAARMMYAYSPDVDIWKVLPPCPQKCFSLAVWRDKLLLIGGKETATLSKETFSNKVVAWDSGRWESSLPPMVIGRVSPIVVSDERYLAVMGGRKGRLGRSVEVLDHDSMQWHTVPYLPFPCQPHTSAVCQNSLFLLHSEVDKILRADLSKFLRQKSIPDSLASLALSREATEEETSDYEGDNLEVGTIWSSIPRSPKKPLQIVAIGGYITAFSSSSRQGKMDVYTFFPESDTWWLTGTTPTLSPSTGCVPSPEGQLYLIGGKGINSKFSQTLNQASFRKSLYN